MSAPTMTTPTDYAIEMEGLTRRFGDFVAVDNVTLKIPKGQLYGFLGLNGAGKTTTIRMLTTLLPPSAGAAKLWGHDVVKEPLAVRKLVLESKGYAVLTAASGQQALSLLAQHRVDLVLSDHLMPGLTGAELARQIKAQMPELPVILISAVNEIPADAANADLFMSKLDGPIAMCENIAAMLDRAKAKIIEGPVPRQGGRKKTGSSVYVRDPDGNLLEFMIYS